MKNYAVIDGLTKDANDKIHTIFDKGYKQGYEDGFMQAQNAHKDVSKMLYNQGQEDVWEFMKKINVMDMNSVSAVFGKGKCMIGDVLRNYTVSEATAIFRDYEEKQSKKKCVDCGYHTGSPSSICDSCVGGSKFALKDVLSVGDEIYSELIKTKAVVVSIDSLGQYQCMNSSGCSFIIDDVTYNKCWRKTGKYLGEVETLLNQLKEG